MFFNRVDFLLNTDRKQSINKVKLNINIEISNIEFIIGYILTV